MMNHTQGQIDEYLRGTRLKFVGYATGTKKPSLICECSCGTVRTFVRTKLKNRRIVSCGCLQKEVTRKIRTIHGKSGSKLYNTWASMMDRCGNPNSAAFKNYGRRGIEVCERWKEAKNFLDDMEGSFKEGLTLERIDNSLGYFPDNCRWATRNEQANNKRSNRLITYKGKTQTLADWARETGIPYSRLRARTWGLGWSIEDAMTLKKRNEYG